MRGQSNNKSTLHLISVSEFELLHKSTECEGNSEKFEKSQGMKNNVIECALACDKYSTLFTYGKKSSSGCHKGMCSCYCQLQTDENGMCVRNKATNHYDLYRYTTSHAEG